MNVMQPSLADANMIETKLVNLDQQRERQHAIDYIKKVIPNWRDLILDDVSENDLHFNGYSGGVDSSVCGLVVALFNPSISLIGICTDSGDEPKCLPSILDRISYLTGQKIVTIQKATLYGKIDENKYLPSPKSRWCTAAIKIKPWEEYISDHFQKVQENSDPSKPIRIFGYAGIRWDERDRSGAIDIKGVSTVLPLIKAKVTREQVCDIASELGLMSGTYFRGRSRSGCQSCMFQSLQEWVSLHMWDPKHFNKALSVEKMHEAIVARLSEDADVGVKDKHWYTLYPMGALLTQSKRSFETNNIWGGIERRDDLGKITWDFEPEKVSKKSRKQTKSKTNSVEEQFDLFGDGVVDASNGHSASIVSLNSLSTVSKSPANQIEEGEVLLYVAIEHYKHPHLGAFGGDDLHGVYGSRLVSYSTTQGGLVRQLHSYYYHRALASRTAWNSIEHYDAESHITTVQIKFPKGIIPKIDYSTFEGVFGWAQGRSLLEIKHKVSWINRVCELYACRQIVQRAKQTGRRSRLVSDAKATIQSYVDAGSPSFGEVVAIGHYRPKPIEERTIIDSYDENLGTVKCFMCSM